MKKNNLKAEDYIPLGLKIMAGAAWRIILIAFLIFALFWCFSHISIIVVPLLIAFLFSALLTPLVNWLVLKKFPRIIAVVISIISLIVIFVSLALLIWQQLASNFDLILSKTIAGFTQLQTLLSEGPFKITGDKINSYIDELARFIQKNSSEILNTAISATTTIGTFFMGLVLVFFATFFFLLDGRKIWDWILRFFPRILYKKIDMAFAKGWVNIGKYVRVQIFVALVDAFGIGIGAFILGVPLAFPLAIMVFLGSFIPIIGAVVSGVIAVLVALVYKGWVIAWIMLAIVLLVQQIESHILQPMVMGKAVSIHPLGIMVAVTGASFIFGIPGALFAVPVTAFINTVLGDLFREPLYKRSYNSHSIDA